jgi:hypothetical protein
MVNDNGYLELTAYLIDVLLRNDRRIRAVGPPRNRQEWGIDRVNAYLRAIGRETFEEHDEAELWRLLRGSIARLPRRRKEALCRLVGLWGSTGWLDDQDIPAPTRPSKYREPVIERVAG